MSGSRGSPEETPLSRWDHDAVKRNGVTCWQQNRNDIRTKVYDEGISWRFLGRNETVDPWGARPNRVYEYPFEIRVGRRVESHLKQKEG